MFKFLGVQVLTLLLIRKYNQTLLFDHTFYKYNQNTSRTYKVSMESSKERKYCNTEVFGFFHKSFYQLVFWIPVQY